MCSTALIDLNNASAIRQSLQSILDHYKISARYKDDAPEDWHAVWQQVRFHSVSHDQQMLSYQYAYLRDHAHVVHDLSIVLLSDGQPCGVLPLSLHQTKDQLKLSSFGTCVSAPQFASALSERTIKRLCSSLIQALLKLGQCLGLSSLDFEQRPQPDDWMRGCTEWHWQLASAGAQIQIRHDLYTDLQLSMSDIRAIFRKSFRPLINVALKSWVHAVVDADVLTDEVWQEFRQLHHDVAGRVTRSAETWQIQKEMVSGRKAFVVTLRDPSSHRLVGAGLFQFTKDECQYAVGAYDRSLFDKPLGHAVQQLAIETMKKHGIRWYFLGERFFPDSSQQVNTKAVSISDFKQGFASHLFCRHLFNLPTNTAHAI